jgi:hypothetical protein
MPTVRKFEIIVLHAPGVPSCPSITLDLNGMSACCSRPTIHRALRSSPVLNFEPVKSPACTAHHQRLNPPTRTEQKPSQKFVQDRGCIVWSSRCGDWVEADWTGAEQTVSIVFSLLRFGGFGCGCLVAVFRAF